MNNKQFVKVPTVDLTETGLEMKDLVVYAYLKKHYNAATKEAFPSFQTIAKESGISKPTVMKSVSRLEKAGYIYISKINKVNHYTFSEERQFEIYSFDFLDDITLSTSEKAYIISMQPHMFKDVYSGTGTVQYSELDIARRLKIDLRTLRKYETSLQQGDRPIMTLIPTTRRDPETGLMLEDRVFNFESFNNILALKFTEVDNNIESLQKRLAHSEAQQAALLREIKELKKQLNTTEVTPIEL